MSRTRGSLIVGGAAFCLAAILAIGSVNAQTKRAPQSAVAQRVERGKYLVAIMSCNDCHTPFKMGPNGPEPDMTRMLSAIPRG